MYQTLALQQLGKIINPITGELERDLQQARITIDMLQMIQKRTLGNLTNYEKVFLDRVVLELQMNFVDEMERIEEVKEKEEGQKGEKEPAAVTTDGDVTGKKETAASEHEAKKKKSGNDRRKKSSLKKRSKKASAKRKGDRKKSKG